MKISVIIPTYNRSHMICDALDSLCQQDLPADDFEVLVVDNNSKDATKSVVEQYIAKHQDCKIRYVFEERQGDYFARNRGAEEAHGTYLVFTDDDALFDTNYLSTILNLFETYPNVGVVGTRIVVKWEGGTPAKWIKPYEYLLGAASLNSIGYVVWSTGMYVNNGSLAVKRDLYISVGGINPAQIGDYVIGDAEGGFCRKIHQLGIPMAFTDDVAMWHRQYVGKNDTIKDICRRFENNVGITKAYTEVIVKGRNEKHKLYPYILRMVWYAITARRRKTLRQYFLYRAEKKYNEYVDRYQFDEEIKQLLQKNNYQWKKNEEDRTQNNTVA